MNSRDEADLAMAQAMIRGADRRTAVPKGDVEQPPVVPPPSEANAQQRELRDDLFALIHLALELSPADRKFLIRSVADWAGVEVVGVNVITRVK